jgi:hypothetical protein
MGRHCSVRLAGCAPFPHQPTCKFLAISSAPTKTKIRLSDLTTRDLKAAISHVAELIPTAHPCNRPTNTATP